MWTEGGGANMTEMWSSANGTSFQELWDKYSSQMEDPFGVLPPSATPSPGIQCMPAPGPFLPCNDLFDWWTLRCSVWIVFLLALLGNGCVVIVLIASRGKMDVPRSVLLFSHLLSQPCDVTLLLSVSRPI